MRSSRGAKRTRSPRAAAAARPSSSCSTRPGWSPPAAKRGCGAAEPRGAPGSALTRTAPADVDHRPAGLEAGALIGRRVRGVDDTQPAGILEGISLRFGPEHSAGVNRLAMAGLTAMAAEFRGEGPHAPPRGGG